MEGWKLNCMSRARRLVLAQSVMGSLSIFHMQLEQLPTCVHKELDKATRRCVWGTSEGHRGVHLLNCDIISKPKRLGGANLKLVKDMNHALLAKLA